MVMKTRLSVEEVAGMLDHSILRPEATGSDVVEGCSTAGASGTAAVCVRPYDVLQAAELLEGYKTEVSAVVGFPHGNSVSAVKVEEARQALKDGAVELEVVSPIGRIRSGDWEHFEKELAALGEIALYHGAKLKIILETCYLTREEITTCCSICDLMEVDFVKTSTGYAPQGARVEHVRLMRESCTPKVSIKAAGGIRTLDHFVELYRAGAERQGTSSTREILRQARERVEKEGCIRVDAGG